MLVVLFCRPGLRRTALRRSRSTMPSRSSRSTKFDDIEARHRRRRDQRQPAGDCNPRALGAGLCFQRVPGGAPTSRLPSRHASSTRRPARRHRRTSPPRPQARARQQPPSARSSTRPWAADPDEPGPDARLEAAQAVFRSRDATALPALEQAWRRGAIRRVKTARRGPRASCCHARRHADAGASGGCGDARASRGDQEALAMPRCACPRRRRRRCRAATAAAAASIERHRSALLAAGAERLCFGISLGSVLLLAAIGLAITFGVMGVINMAHGEMVMLGAYTTFVVQEFCRTLSRGLSTGRWPIAVPRRSSSPAPSAC